MCLLLTGKSATLRSVLLDTPGLIEDVYQANSDGLGVMYATKNHGLKVVKKLPASANAARDMVAALPNDDRDVAMHWRYKTHGAIDMDNCHPYKVNDSTWLMHNGILHTGNRADESKSDTWHFVKNYLAGLGDDALHDKGLLEMMGEFIKNNRFAIMSADGRLSVVNEDQGIETHGLWFSNTYAWSPEILIPSYRKHYTFGGFSSGFSGKGYSRFGGYIGLADVEDETGYEAAHPQLTLAHGSMVEDEEDELDDASAEYAYMAEVIEESLYNFNMEELEVIFAQYGEGAIEYVLHNYTVAPWHKFDPATAEKGMVTLVQAWRDGDVDAIMKHNAYDQTVALLMNSDWQEKVLVS